MTRRRKRVKSSPNKACTPTSKKHKTANKHLQNLQDESDSDNSLYFEIENFDTESEIFEISQPPQIKSNMASSLSKADLKELGMVIADSIKADIIREIKKDLVCDFQRMVKAELTTFTENHLKESAVLQDEITGLKQRNDELSQTLSRTQLELDELDQYGRRMCLEISGIPGDTHNNSENVLAKVLEHTRGAKIDLSKHDIDRCHRLGKPKGNMNRKVILKFTNSSARQRIYEARKTFGDGIFVQENLTRLRQQLCYEARQLVRANKLTKTWIAGCRVFASMPGLLPETLKTIQITDMSVIQAIKDGKTVI